jgi:hypothetical protein
MRIAYLTTDEVNKDLALRLAAQWDVTVCLLEPRDPPPDGQFDAVLYDWDHWPADHRPETMTGGSGDSIRYPVALHGYRLEKGQARALRRKGVLLFDRLEPKTLLDLYRAVNQARAPMEQDDTVDLGRPEDTPFPCVAAVQSSEGAANSPSCRQRGYTAKCDPPLPSPHQGASRRKTVYRNRCLRCQNQAEGMDYRFAVVESPSPGYHQVHEEKAFVCNRCAEARLRRSAWLVLFTWVPLGFLAFGVLFALAVSVYINGNPFRPGYVPTAGALFLLSMALLVITGLLVGLVWRHLRWVTGKSYQYDRFPEAVVTRMAIQLRKKEILSWLDLPEESASWLPPEN